MISTIHGPLDLMVVPVPPVVPSEGQTRMQICTVRGQALGQHVNVQVCLDANSGELLLFSPDGFAGSFRLGDLIAAHVQRAVAAAAAQRREEAHAPQTH